MVFAFKMNPKILFGNSDYILNTKNRRNGEKMKISKRIVVRFILFGAAALLIIGCKKKSSSGTQAEDSEKPEGQGTSSNASNCWVEVDSIEDKNPAAIISGKNGKVFVVGTYKKKDDGKYYVFIRKSVNNGDNWETVYDKKEDNRSYIKDLEIDSSGNLYRTQQHSVMISKDDGKSWTQVNLHEKFSPIALDLLEGIHVDKNDNVYAFDHSWKIFKSSNQGSDWIKLEGEHEKEMHEMFVDDEGNIYAVGIQMGSQTSIKRNDKLVLRIQHKGSNTWKTSYREGVDSGGHDIDGVTVDPSGQIYILGYGLEDKDNYNWDIISTGDQGATWKVFSQLSYQKKRHYPDGLLFIENKLFVYADNFAFGYLDDSNNWKLRIDDSTWMAKNVSFTIASNGTFLFSGQAEQLDWDVKKWQVKKYVCPWK